MITIHNSTVHFSRQQIEVTTFGDLAPKFIQGPLEWTVEGIPDTFPGFPVSTPVDIQFQMDGKWLTGKGHCTEARVGLIGSMTAVFKGVSSLTEVSVLDYVDMSAPWPEDENTFGKNPWAFVASGSVQNPLWALGIPVLRRSIIVIDTIS